MRKNTKQKDIILSALKNTTSHPTADWVFDQVKEEIPNISLGTIYRNLRQLAEIGEILELHIDGSHGRFDHNTKSHCHLRCIECERIFDLIIPECSQMIERLNRQRGLKISSYMVIFSGLCMDCQEAENVQSGASS